MERGSTVPTRELPQPSSEPLTVPNFTFRSVLLPQSSSGDTEKQEELVEGISEGNNTEKCRENYSEGNQQWFGSSGVTFGSHL